MEITKRSCMYVCVGGGGGVFLSHSIGNTCGVNIPVHSKEWVGCECYTGKIMSSNCQMCNEIKINWQIGQLLLLNSVSIFHQN